MIQLGPKTMYIAGSNSKCTRKNCLGTCHWSSTGRKSYPRLFFPFENLKNSSWMRSWSKEWTKEITRQTLSHKIRSGHKTSYLTSARVVVTPIGAGVGTLWYLPLSSSASTDASPWMVCQSIPPHNQHAKAIIKTWIFHPIPQFSFFRGSSHDGILHYDTI